MSNWTCPKCHINNAGSQKFCGNCGQQQELSQSAPDDLPPTIFSIGGNQPVNQPFVPPSNPFNPPPPQFGNQGNASGSSVPPPINSPFAQTSQPSRSKMPFIIGGIILIVLLGGGAILAIGGFILYNNSKTTIVRNTSNPYTSPSNEKMPISSSSNKPFDSLRQNQIGSYKLSKTEKTNYMKMYPNLEEESLTYANSSGKKVFVTKTRFPSRAEAERVVKDMIKVAKDGGGVFTETTTATDDGQDVGLVSTKIADKNGTRNYTRYYSFDNVVTFIFSLENDTAAVEELYKYSTY